MQRPLCYDVTRLLTRVLNATPNGIDRIDHRLATHFLSQEGAPRLGLTSTGFGARLMNGNAAAEAVAGIAAHWSEAPAGRGWSVGHSTDPLPADPVYEWVVARLTGAAAPGGTWPGEAMPARRSTLRADVTEGLRWVGRHGVPLLRRPTRELPRGSVYFNASQFPLWVEASFAWLTARRDVKAAFFIHDLLPISMPEYFRTAEYARHLRRMANLARFATAAVVTTQTVADDLRAHLHGLGRTDLAVFVAPTPVAPIFSEPRQVEARLNDHPFFVLCSTIEPRKNHLMILAAWRDLVRRHGAAAPKLVLVGTRGWKYELIVDLLDRSPPLRDHVIAVRGLSTPGLKRLMDNARAVLMPSFAEGYGLPVHEALAAGVPVLASDIPVFREIGARGLTLLSPLNGEAWLEAAHRLSQTERPEPSAAERRGPLGEEVGAGAGWSDYFGRLDRFVGGL